MLVIHVVRFLHKSYWSILSGIKLIQWTVISFTHPRTQRNKRVRTGLPADVLWCLVQAIKDTFSKTICWACFGINEWIRFFFFLFVSSRHLQVRTIRVRNLGNGLFRELLGWMYYDTRSFTFCDKMSLL